MTIEQLRYCRPGTVISNGSLSGVVQEHGFIGTTVAWSDGQTGTLFQSNELLATMSVVKKD